MGMPMEIDQRIPRLWFVPNAWETISAPRTVTDYLESSALLQKTSTWPVDCPWERVNLSPHLFLSRSPLTFGHSQVVVPCREGSEDGLFRVASRIIRCAIQTFSTAFLDQKLHESEQFKTLAEATLTYGSYIKTLVLRASAEEKTKTDYTEYKVHLVPYFSSHGALCKNRYLSLHAVEPKDNDTGGLLGWLGKREDEVDRWEAHKSHREELDPIANGRQRMPEFSQILREIYPSLLT
jgi:hypothetical protein